jgi:hypothetical protein
MNERRFGAPLLGLVLRSVQLLMNVDLHAARASSRARVARSRRQVEVRVGLWRGIE